MKCSNLLPQLSQLHMCIETVNIFTCTYWSIFYLFTCWPCEETSAHQQREPVSSLVFYGTFSTNRLYHAI